MYHSRQSSFPSASPTHSINSDDIQQYIIFVAVGWVYGIVVDPVGDRLYFGGKKGVGVTNMDGTDRKKLIDVHAVSLAVDLKEG